MKILKTSAYKKALRWTNPNDMQTRPDNDLRTHREDVVSTLNQQRQTPEHEIGSGEVEVQVGENTSNEFDKMVINLNRKGLTANQIIAVLADKGFKVSKPEVMKVLIKNNLIGEFGEGMDIPGGLLKDLNMDDDEGEPSF